MGNKCECSDEYGPCEQHGETLVVREGASTRTADELALCLIDDLSDLGAELSPYGADIVAQARKALDESEGFCNWIDDADLSQELYSVADQVESYVADLWVIHDDGYRIVRPSADCPLFGDES